MFHSLPKNQMQQVKTINPVWDRAKGSYIYDSDGNKYIDFTSGVIATNLGHGHPKIVRALNKAINKPLLFCYKYPFLEKSLLEKSLLEFTDRNFQSITFASTGAEAIEISMRVCLRRFDNQNDCYFVSFTNGYHGKTMGASLLSDISRKKSKVLADTGRKLVRKLSYPISDLQADKVYKKLVKFKGKCVGVYIETIQGSTLEKVNTRFLKLLRKWTAKNKITLVIDEIQTGFYRTGQKFSYDMFGIKPDIICIGKGLTCSLPLTAVLASSALSKYMDTSMDSSTFSANPVAVSAGLAAIEEYNTKRFKSLLTSSVRNYTQMMNYFRKNLKDELHVLHPGGIIGGISINGQKDNSSIAEEIVYFCRKNGLFIGLPVGPRSNIVKLTPPLTTQTKEYKKAASILFEALLQTGLIRN